MGIFLIIKYGQNIIYSCHKLRHWGQYVEASRCHELTFWGNTLWLCDNVLKPQDKTYTVRAQASSLRPQESTLATINIPRPWDNILKYIEICEIIYWKIIY